MAGRNGKFIVFVRGIKRNRVDKSLVVDVVKVDSPSVVDFFDGSVVKGEEAYWHCRCQPPPMQLPRKTVVLVLAPVFVVVTEVGICKACQAASSRNKCVHDVNAAFGAGNTTVRFGK